MTQLLEKVLTEVYKSPPEKQDTIAAVILEEHEDERLWDKTFVESEDQLANASDVQIIIYDTKGIVIRTLALGYQSAGYYTSRSRAVYWDGQNGLGESIASGVYFYKLQTDETSLMRKMVILK